MFVCVRFSTKHAPCTETASTKKRASNTAFVPHKILKLIFLPYFLIFHVWTAENSYNLQNIVLKIFIARNIHIFQISDTMVAQNPTSISSGGRKQPQKQDKVQKKQLKKIYVVKIKRIPFGFFEKELLGYFRQFGNVLRIRVARNRRVGSATC